MAEKGMEQQVLKTSVMGVMESVLAKMSEITASEQAQVNECDILEYENRMRVGGMEKFNAPSFISVVNFYINAADKERHKAKGSLVVYVDFENASKLFNALGFSIPDDEDDVSLMNACGEFCNLIAGNFKKDLTRLGYADLVLSAANNYKNSVIEGVEFSSDQKKKIECSFYYWRRKAIVVEVTMATIPRKKM